VQPTTVLSQTTQCLTVFLLRCGEFRKLRTKMYFAANCCQPSDERDEAQRRHSVGTHMGVHDRRGAQTRNGKTVAHALEQRSRTAKRRRRDVLSDEVVHNRADDLRLGRALRAAGYPPGRSI
jgi:hypothetical protein